MFVNKIKTEDHQKNLRSKIYLRKKQKQPKAKLKSLSSNFPRKKLRPFWSKLQQVSTSKKIHDNKLLTANIYFQSLFYLDF